MKKLVLVALVLINSLISKAEMSNLSASKITISPSTVESITLLQNERETTTPRIALVKIDNGGSTDIGSLMASSTLYLSFHLDGEEFDIQSDFKIAELNTIEKATYDKAGKTIHLIYTKKDETLKLQKISLNLYISKVLNEIDFVKKQGQGAIEGVNGIYSVGETIGCLIDQTGK